MIRKRVIVVGVVGALLVGAPPLLQGGITSTAHNLSASGSGEVKASGTDELCVFCHTPHRADASQALWNRDLPPTTYKLYASSTLAASLRQPTGASRLCLSCHDGTTALGNLRVPPSTGSASLPPLTGSALLGTDLSDDHPISFVYDASLAAQRGALADPSTLPATLPLDSTQQMQCTTCHDPHGTRFRQFLRVTDRQGSLCSTCHLMGNWTQSAHAQSLATWRGTGTNPWPRSPYPTMSENACGSCHQPHAAAHPARLLGQAQESTGCLVCHAGAVASKNLEPELLKASAHPMASTNWVHDTREDPRTMPRHVACADCHNPHQAASTPADPNEPGKMGALKGVSGVNALGASIGKVELEQAIHLQEYEVCFKCHGITDQRTPGIERFDATRNVRLEFSMNNASYHPVEAPVRNPPSQPLEAGYTASSLITCGDCHNNDERGGSSAAPSGPHGSRYEPILARQYEQSDGVTESYPSYALCYRCHNREAVLRSPPHGHVDQGRVSCAVCHDAHGSRRWPRLINFMLRDKAGRSVVGPSRGVVNFIATGDGHGECTLTCHGMIHDRWKY